MKERELTPFVRDENPEIFILDENEWKEYDKAKKDIVFLMSTIDEFMKGGNLTTGEKNMYCGLLEAYALDYTKSLKYEGEMEAEKQQRFEEIRGLNQENRELRRQLGEKVSLEDVREKVKNIEKIFKEWWNRKGFGHQSNPRISEGGFYCEISGIVFGSHYDEDNMDDEDKVAYLASIGFTMDDRRVIMNDNNMKLLNDLLISRFPSCSFFKCETTHYRTCWVMHDITIRISDLTDFQ